MSNKRRRGLIMVVTGDGKGKTTSALGLVFRALGNGFKVFMVQYIKGKWKTGEKKLADLLQHHAEHLGLHLEIRPMGDGFTWDTKNREQDIATTRHIWDVSKEGDQAPLPGRSEGAARNRILIPWKGEIIMPLFGHHTKTYLGLDIDINGHPFPDGPFDHAIFLACALLAAYGA